jgi:Fe2+ or Zn2+ uptake regulation protein
MMGMTVKGMCLEHEELKEKTVYRRLAFLKTNNLIPEEYEKGGKKINL